MVLSFATISLDALIHALHWLHRVGGSWALVGAGAGALLGWWAVGGQTAGHFDDLAELAAAGGALGAIIGGLYQLARRKG